MNAMSRITVIVIITLSIGLSAAQSESKAKSKDEKKIEDNFEVSWTRISYTKTVSLSNTDGSEDQDQDVSERMSLSCEVGILDPNFVLGVSRAPVIEEMTDGEGGKIEIDTGSSSSFQMRYEAPRYDRRFVPPTRPAKWKTAVRSALRLPPKESSQSRWVEQIRPVRMQIDLNVGLGEKSTEKIGRVKGYFHALVAESYEYVDVPFKTSDKWHRLTPDVEIQVRDAWCRDSSFRLSTKARPERGMSMHSLSADSYLPERMVVDRQFINDKGETRNSGGFRRLPFSVGGGMSGSGGFEGTIEKVRYTIAVNPTHYEIPFMLENIPLPKP